MKYATGECPHCGRVMVLVPDSQPFTYQNMSTPPQQEVKNGG